MENQDFIENYNFLKEISSDQSDLCEVMLNRFWSYTINENEITGEIVRFSVYFLNWRKCPKSLIGQIVGNIIDPTKEELLKLAEAKGCSKDSLDFYRAIKSTIIGSIKNFCQRLLDNAEFYRVFPIQYRRIYPQHAVESIQNCRRRLEDRYICLDGFNEIFPAAAKRGKRASFYGVFDGHDGFYAASYSASQLPALLASDPNYPNNPEIALRNAFNKTDQWFVEKSIKQNLRGGTTAACALYIQEDSQLHIAWVGDSKILLAKQGELLQLVKAHTVACPNESRRILSQGGQIIYCAGSDRVNGLLNLTRAIGDTRLKPYIISDPEVISINLDNKEDFLIISCDGLWDYVQDHEVASLVYSQIRNEPDNLEKITQKLIDLSKAKGSEDNITIIVVFFKHPSEIIKGVWPFVKMDNILIDNSTSENETKDFTSNNHNKIELAKDLIDTEQQLIDGFTDSNKHSVNISDNKTIEKELIPFSESLEKDNYNIKSTLDLDMGPETSVDMTDEVAVSKEHSFKLESSGAGDIINNVINNDDKNILNLLVENMNNTDLHKPMHVPDINLHHDGIGKSEISVSGSIEDGKFEGQFNSGIQNDNLDQFVNEMNTGNDINYEKETDEKKTCTEELANLSNISSTMGMEITDCEFKINTVNNELENKDEFFKKENNVRNIEDECVKKSILITHQDELSKVGSQYFESDSIIEPVSLIDRKEEEINDLTERKEEEINNLIEKKEEDLNNLPVDIDLLSQNMSKLNYESNYSSELEIGKMNNLKEFSGSFEHQFDFEANNNESSAVISTAHSNDESQEEFNVDVENKTTEPIPEFKTDISEERKESETFLERSDEVIPDSCEDSEDEWKFMKPQNTDEIKKVDNDIDTSSKSAVLNENKVQAEINIEIANKTVLDNSDLIQESKIIDISAVDFASKEPEIKSEQQQDSCIDQEVDDMNSSQLNPEAKEFVPTSPPIVFEGNALTPDNAIIYCLNNYEVIAQSPRKGAISMENIQLPSENEFDHEIANRPSELLNFEGNIDLKKSKNESTENIILEPECQNGIASQKIISPINDVNQDKLTENEEMKDELLEDADSSINDEINDLKDIEVKEEIIEKKVIEKENSDVVLHKTEQIMTTTSKKPTADNDETIKAKASETSLKTKLSGSETCATSLTKPTSPPIVFEGNEMTPESPIIYCINYDEMISQSPRKGAISMENIQLPSENEFDHEIANRPSELLDFEGNIDLDKSRNKSTENTILEPECQNGIASQEIISPSNDVNQDKLTENEEMKDELLEDLKIVKGAESIVLEKSVEENYMAVNKKLTDAFGDEPILQHVESKINQTADEMSPISEYSATDLYKKTHADFSINDEIKDLKDIEVKEEIIEKKVIEKENSDVVLHKTEQIITTISKKPTAGTGETNKTKASGTSLKTKLSGSDACATSRTKPVVQSTMKKMTSTSEKKLVGKSIGDTIKVAPTLSAPIAKKALLNKAKVEAAKSVTKTTATKAALANTKPTIPLKTQNVSTVLSKPRATPLATGNTINTTPAPSKTNTAAQKTSSNRLAATAVKSSTTASSAVKKSLSPRVSVTSTLRKSETTKGTNAATLLAKSPTTKTTTMSKTNTKPANALVSNLAPKKSAGILPRKPISKKSTNSKVDIGSNNTKTTIETITKAVNSENGPKINGSDVQQ